ncbi:MAG: thiamine-monophosphate kinase [Candidatus Hodarchaeota archaeon]
MKNNDTLSNLGEFQIIEFIEDLVFQKTGKRLIRDDSFFFSLDKNMLSPDGKQVDLIFNTDMLVSTTDVPKHMSFYQIGRKAVLMNLSDLIVKGVKPRGIFISFGLYSEMELSNLRDLMNGIIDYCVKWNIDYIGGDVNETKELIINPTIFGVHDCSKIVHRKGIKSGNYLVANGKFGLNGVGFDILLNKRADPKEYSIYKRSIMSVLEPEDLGNEAIILSEKNLATASIDSSDGLAKSLTDLMYSNREIDIGFEIEFNEELIDEEAFMYSEEFNIPLENLVFYGGEEFIHIFTIDPKSYDSALKAIKSQGGQIFQIGKVISEKKIYFLNKSEKIELKKSGFEHFK